MAFTFDILFEIFIRGMHIHDDYNEDDEYDAVCSNERKTRLIWWAFTLNIPLEIFIFG